MLSTLENGGLITPCMDFIHFFLGLLKILIKAIAFIYKWTQSINDYKEYGMKVDNRSADINE